MSSAAPGFAELVAHLDPAMAVVTTASGGERAGCLVGFHAQCSIEPSRYAVWLSKANHTFRVALHAERIAVHFLDVHDRALATLFGTTSGDRVDKFAACEWEPDRDGIPLLTGCGNRLSGTKVALLDVGGDHVCLVVGAGESSTSDSLNPMRLSQVKDLAPGHGAEERPSPLTERAGH
jgi:flavin reductase (DIM6/NTAB) family NADH-FMN oxidoreductase RutF